MEVDCIPFQETGYFSKLICDYLNERKELKPFYNRFPKLRNFSDQIEEKKANYNNSNREVVVSALSRQYEGLKISKSTRQHIDSLRRENTFTVTTGHQLNLFTGPIYFLYKIVSTINLCKTLKKEYPKYNFVPMYWMATEDHDFDEINHFGFKGQKIAWERDASGAVGELETGGLDKVVKVFSAQLGDSGSAKRLLSLFEKSYLEHENLADATRYLVNELFGANGLVILDGNDAALKRTLTPYIAQDIFENTPYHKVSNTITALSAVSQEYRIQVNPREVNYFYLKKDLRERLEVKGDKYHVVNTNLSFSKEELESELEKHPERFSPNVIARPLYQEVLLPNLCYIGGGGELAYWLEFKSYFDTMGISFPMLLLRNSALLLTEKQRDKVEKLDLKVRDLFLEQNKLVEKRVHDISEIAIDFSAQKAHLEKQFEHLYGLAEKTDKSFLGAVKAQEAKQKNGLERLEKRLLKAQKRKLKDHVDRTKVVQDRLFPNQSLQERQANFSSFYMELGEDLIPFLLKRLDPMDQRFLILQY